MVPKTAERVPKYTAQRVNAEIRRDIDRRLRYFAAHPELIDKRLREIVGGMRRRRGQVDPLEDTDCDVDFHMAVAEASHNVALVHVMRGIFNLMRINMLRSREALCHQAENVALLDAQHVEIAKAIAARDPKAARAAANIHLSFVQASLREAAGVAERKGADGTTGAAAPATGPARSRKRVNNDNAA